MALTHVAAAAASFLAGALFMRIGWEVRRRRPPTGEPQQALRAFSVWWLAIGLSTIVNGGLVLAGAAGSLPAALVARWAGLALAAVAFWGLLTYIAYIYLGDHRASRPLAVAYAVALGVALASTVWPTPGSLVVGAWTADVLPPTTDGSRPVVAVLLVAFLVPPVVAGPLFLRLLQRTEDAAQRRRLLAVGVGIPVWSLTHLVARLSDADAWQAFTRVVVGVVVALLIARAYLPRDPAVPRRADALDEAMRMRVRELV